MADIIAHRAARSRTSKCAHVMERLGLAMAGASCGLFVAAHVSSAGIPALGSASVSLILMMLGAIGFYLGIDVPPHRTRTPGDGKPPTDPVELWSAAGTFLAAMAAFISVYSIITDAEATTATTIALTIAWLVGACMQIVAGATARMRKTI